jgi:hypothetical protein
MHIKEVPSSTQVKEGWPKDTMGFCFESSEYNISSKAN